MRIWGTLLVSFCWCGQLVAQPELPLRLPAALGQPALGQPALGQPALGETQQARAEHLVTLGVDRWHRAGWRGQGCKVAILDGGFRDWRKYLGKGLPDRVVVRSFRHDGNLEA